MTSRRNGLRGMKMRLIGCHSDLTPLAAPGVNTATAYNNLSEVTSVTLGTGSLAETTTNTWDNLGRKTKIHTRCRAQRKWRSI